MSDWLYKGDKPKIYELLTMLEAALETAAPCCLNDNEIEALITHIKKHAWSPTYRLRQTSVEAIGQSTRCDGTGRPIETVNDLHFQIVLDSVGKWFSSDNLADMPDSAWIGKYFRLVEVKPE